MDLERNVSVVAEQRLREQWGLTVNKTAKLKTVMGITTCEKLSVLRQCYSRLRGQCVYSLMHISKSSLKSLNVIENELTMSGSSYRLVAVILGNSAHLCEITSIHGKHLLYDGMFQGKRLRLV